MAKGILDTPNTPTPTSSTEETSTKKRKLQPQEKSILLEKWNDFETRVKEFEIQSVTLDSSAFVFSFVEGSLVKAIRNGEWLLLDEINLASSDTLESIADLLSEVTSQRSVLLTERGDVESIIAHPEFRIFGCMNPSTDVGKRDLPLSIRSRFSELYVHSPDKDIQDLLSIIDKYIGRFSIADEWVGNDVAELYLTAKRLSEENKIVDGANQRPHFSIRTLTRTLIYVCDIVSIYGLRRALYEAFCMSYLTLLDAKSEKLLHDEIVKFILGRLKNVKSVLNQTPPSPGSDFVQFKHYWMKRGSGDIIPQPHYIITPFVEKNMLNLVRATAGRRFPVLVQGPTSAGKTSMIQYLANITGHKFVRINNHEHTDLQEYLGTYMSDSTGKLVFREGILVEALRKGHWIVLDELNLAPTDVLEALNRLLDDNRELFIPETQEVIRPHPDFMLFATQNPPGLYGGRKMLSRAFRNRFLELHFDDIPQDELEIILRERCKIAPTYGKKIVEVYRQLSIQRQSTRLFEQKNSFATLRDLFRWAMRDAVGYEELAANGFMLLGERVRKNEEKEVVRQTIEKVMRVKLDMDEFYSKLEIEASLPEIMERTSKDSSSIVWTKAMRRLAVLVFTSMKFKEPLLLVGETGCGKTTVCQIIAEFLNRKLITVNAHQNTETGDILGAQRPVRHRFETQSKLYNKLMVLMKKLDIEIELDDSKLDELIKKYDSLREKIQEEQKENSEEFEQLIQEIDEGRRNASILFDWNDGPLVQAMKNGEFFLLDEISLADDSVLERLNSVLEPERSLLLAEKGNEDSFVTAAETFEFLATMNPGGDYGKKELSPALRNRFTEIWVPSMENFNDVRQIVSAKLDDRVTSQLCEPLVQFSEWYGQRYGSGNASSGVISLRDILAWVQFVNSIVTKNPEVSPNVALLHGAAMVFIDALGTNNTAYLAENEERLNLEKLAAVGKLSELVGMDLQESYTANVVVEMKDDKLTCGNFDIDRKETQEGKLGFNLEAPTTAANAMRVVRAMQVRKPILLEGSPGVGKTSLVSALAKATGNPLVRINLSEQTDLVDLFGSDAPAEGGKTGEFVWRDAPFLRAMQRGEWVLLDEMNLASQSVLEGLNACLDHRGSAYIPELDKTFERHPEFIVFAAQNPQYQGGGRKGLPKSFVNRFSVVYVDMLKEQDLNMISQHLFPAVAENTSEKMIRFISRLEHEVSVKKSFGHNGGPWEFNLRDTLRWLDLFSKRGLTSNIAPSDFLDMIVCQRFRCTEDRMKAQQLFLEVFGEEQIPKQDNYYSISKNSIQAGGAVISRNEPIQHTISSHGDGSTVRFALQSNFPLLETSIRCINLKLPLILTGPTNSGKTELIRFLAETVGAQIDEFAMNSDVDSMDILGGYEQVDVERGVSSLAARIRSILVELIVANLKVGNTDAIILEQALKFVLFIDNRGKETGQRFSRELHKHLGLFLNSFTNTELLEILADSTALQKKVEDLKNNSVRFEWFDGLLVQAVEQGHWLVLDNANLCSPSVLDRLNSLLEVNGTLVINECSAADGQPRTIVPHPNFRLFLTVDPKYGELSRAMRNRGIEVFIPSLDDRMTVFDRKLIRTSARDSDEDTKFDSMPASGFLSPQRSLERSLAMVHDTLDISTLENEDLVNTLVGTIPFDNVELLPLWKNAVSQSSEFSNSCKNFLHLLNSKFDEGLFNNVTLNKLMNLYEPAKSELADGILTSVDEFIGHQTLQPLINTYLTTLGEGAVLTSEPVFLFEAVAGVWEVAKLVKSLEERALAKKLGELSYIERSTAFQLGRNLKKEPRLNIYKFIVGVKDYIAAGVKDKILESSCSDISLFETDNHFFESIVELQLTLRCLLETSNQQDESRLRVYQDLVRQWCDNSTISTKGEVEKVVESFGEELKLTSGFSIAKLWERLRRSYPSSSVGWNQTEAIFRLSEQFDNVAREQFKDSSDAVTTLRSVIVSIYQEIQTNSEENELSTEVFEKFCSDLEGGIKNLKEVSNQFIIKRNNVVQEEYTLLTALVESLEMMHNSNSKGYEKLKSLAARSTVSECLTSNDNNLFSPYPAIFDNIWSIANGQCKSLVPAMFSNELLTNSLLKSEHLGKGAGKYLEQNLDDIKTFTGSLVNSSQSVLDNKVQIFSELLIKWILEIVNIHLTDTSSISVELIDKNSIEKTIQEIRLNIIDDRFLEVLDNFFFPAMFLIANSESNLGILGKAWVMFSCGAVQLYVPTTAYDPAISDYVEYDRFQRHKIEAATLIESWKSTRTVISGDEKIKAELLLEDSTIASIQSKETEKPRVYRPQSSIDNLFDEWSAFLTSTIDIDPIKKLLEAAEDVNNIEGGARLMNMFQNNSSHFLLRLQQSYLLYADLNDILRGFVYGMKLGFDLLSVEIANVHSKYSNIPNTWSVDSAGLASCRTVVNTFTDVKEFSKSFSVDSTIPEKIMMFFVRLCFAHEKTSSQLDAGLESVLQQSFQTLYYRWSLRRMKKDEEDAALGNLYKYSDPTSDLEGDFRELFPDFEEVMDGDSAAAVSTTKTSESVFEELYSKIGQLYVSSFMSTNDKLFELSTLVKEGNTLHSLLNKHVSEFGAHNTSASLTSIISSISSNLDSFRSERTDELDFYRGNSPLESKRSIDIIKSLQVSALKLLAQWPEHVTLQDISRICDEYLSFPIDIPLARLLQKIEQIYTYIAEWEKFASSQVTLKTHFDVLTQLIVSWRKLELSTWKALFSHEDSMVLQGLGRWWFHLFESIIIPLLNEEIDEEDDSGNAEVKLIAALNVFMSQATYGEFDHRLDLLRAFRNHVKIIDSEDRVKITDALSNFITFYEQFIPTIQENMARQRKTLEKDISEVILLASWKDVNIDALKQSARRSHNNLYKIVRKYRALLAIPVSSIIELGISIDMKVNVNVKEIGQVRAYDGVENVNVSDIVSTVSTWSERPKRLQNIELVSKNMSVYISRVAEDTIPFISDYAKDIVQEMDRLRSETPKELKKDNKKIIATLLVQKRKLLSDTLRELRRIGLKTSLRADIHKLQETVTMMICNSKSFEEFELLKGSDAYYYRILDLMPRLRSAVSGLVEGVPQSDADKGLAAAENLVFSLVTTRKPLSLFAKSMSQVEAIYSTLSNVSTSLLSKNQSLVRGTMSKSVNLNIHTIKQCIFWLLRLIDFAIQNIQSIGQFTPISTDNSVFYAAKAKLQNISVKLDNSSRISIVELELSVIQEFRDFFYNDFIVGLNEWKLKPGHENLSFIADTILEWVAQQQYDVFVNSDTSVTTLEALKTVEDVELRLRDLSTSIILCVQKVINECDKGAIKEEDDNWLVLSQQRAMEYVKTLHHRKIVLKLEAIMKLVNQIEHNANTSRVSAALLAFSMPIIQRYYELCMAIMKKVRKNYIETSKGTFILSSSLYLLATKGFCSPEPPSEQKEDNNNLHDGTGLGEGEGATNNSKDVEEDEDLAEDAQQPNEEKKEKDDGDDDENDDAVDIEGDMAGELEDASDQDKDDDEEDEGEDEELDEEIDDIDDLDPNAVDDKMWDEEAQDNSKEKDSEKMPDNANQDEDNMQANEDEENDKSDQNQQQPEDSKEDGNDDEKDEDDNDGEDGDDEKDVGEQEDEVKNQDNEQLEENVPETETLDLPEDMNLDSGDEKSGDEDEDDQFDDKMDVEKAEQEDEKKEDEDGEEANEEDIDVEQDGSGEDDENEDENEDEDADGQEANADGTNEDEGMDSEEEVLGENNEEEQENDDEDGGNDDNTEAQEKAEGVDGANEDAANDEMDVETSVKQESGEKGDGADNQVVDENDDIGATGGASSDAQQDMEKKEEEEKNNEDARDMARESLKQLGDSLKEFHRRRQEIQEASTRDEDVKEENNSANERPDEFEHLEGENADFDTQALGAAEKDQVQSIDEDKAIDDDLDNQDIKQEDAEEENDDMNKEDEDKMEVDEEENNFDQVKEDGDFEGQTRGSSGDQDKAKEEDVNDILNNGEAMDLDDDDEDEEDEEVAFDVNKFDFDDAPPIEIDEARELWKHSELATQELASGLCEQLRLILEPTLATKLRGDYKTGKRLNMKRIIPYIASDFRKDKIWLRRTKPSKRQYQIMIAIDDSKSMSESKSTELAFHSIALVSKALTQLESGVFLLLDSVKTLELFIPSIDHLITKKVVLESSNGLTSSKPRLILLCCVRRV